MNQTRREFIKTVGAATAVISLPNFLTSCAKSDKPPNIIFIMSDDHAEQAISCYDSKFINTPNIDRIAKEGIRFTNSFVTNSICGPSRAAMLTGKYSHKNGFYDHTNEFDGSQMTFTKLLQKAGYKTGIVGKWHLKSTPTGFDDWQILPGQGQYYNPDFIENGIEKTYIGYATDIITDKAIDYLNKRDKQNPFCLLVHHKAPHRNWMPNVKHLNEFENVEFPEPETLFDDYENRPAAEAADMRIEGMYLSFDLKLNREIIGKETGTGGKESFAKNAIENWENSYNRLTGEQKQAWDKVYNKRNEEFKNAKLSGKDLTRWKYQQYMKDYLRCILSVDENVGRILDYLDQNDLADNTIVVYTSDQGFYLGEHGWYDKRFMYEESLGMPLVMRYPGVIKAGQVSDRMVMNIDFAPTFLEFAGVKSPVEIQGESLKSLLTNSAPADWRESIYYHYYSYPQGWHGVKRHYGIRTDRYKLIHFYNDIDHWELYDLKYDPNEVNNVYRDPAYTEIALDLKDELRRLQKKYEDDIDL